MEADELLPLEVWHHVAEWVAELDGSRVDGKGEEGHGLASLSLTCRLLRQLCLGLVRRVRYREGDAPPHQRDGTSGSDACDFFRFVEACGRVEELDLRGCASLGTPRLPLSALPSLPSLTSLDLSRAKAWEQTDEGERPQGGIANLLELRDKAFWHGLRKLNLEGNRCFSNDCIRERIRRRGCKESEGGSLKRRRSEDAKGLMNDIDIGFPPNLQLIEGGLGSTLEHLYLSGCREITSRGTAAMLEGLRDGRLHTLFISFTRIVNEAVVSSLPESLQVLSVNNSNICPAEIAVPLHLPLELAELYMGGCSGIFTRSLVSLPSTLCVLQLDHLFIADTGVQGLPPTLRELSLLDTPLLTEEAIQAIPRGLRILHVGSILNDRSVQNLPPALERLYAHGSELSDKGLGLLPSGLRHLSLIKCSRVSAQGIARLNSHLRVEYYT